MSVGAPTWRGLKRSTVSGPAERLLNVSRCPDMEGIETTLILLMTSTENMSVGAPTWRGLKPLARQGNQTNTHNVSRCPDMEGIETIQVTAIT